MTDDSFQKRMEVWGIIGKIIGEAIERSNRAIASLAGQIKVPPKKICLALEGKILLKYEQLVKLAALTKMPSKDWKVIETALSSIGEKYIKRERRADPGFYYAAAVELEKKGLRARHFEEIIQNEKFAKLAAQLIRAAYNAVRE